MAWETALVKTLGWVSTLPRSPSPSSPTSVQSRCARMQTIGVWLGGGFLGASNTLSIILWDLPFPPPRAKLPARLRFCHALAFSELRLMKDLKALVCPYKRFFICR